MEAAVQRWTARRKADLALEIIQGQKAIVDAAREHDLRQSEIQEWIETFMEFGRNGLKTNPKNAAEIHEAQLKQHREKIGELVLQIDVLEKAKKLLAGDENSSSE